MSVQDKQTKQVKSVWRGKGKRCVTYGADFSLSPFRYHSANKVRKSNLVRFQIEAQRTTGFHVDFKTSHRIDCLPDRWDVTGEDFFKKEVDSFMGEIVKKKEIKAEQIVDEIAKIAFSKTGTPFLQEGDDERLLKINIKDKLKALDMLAKWAGLYEKDNKQRAATTQLLQVAFIGSEKVDQLEDQNASINEQKRRTIWDKEMEEKKEEILNVIEKTATPKEVLQKRLHKDKD